MKNKFSFLAGSMCILLSAISCTKEEKVVKANSSLIENRPNNVTTIRIYEAVEKGITISKEFKKLPVIINPSPTQLKEMEQLHKYLSTVSKEVQKVIDQQNSSKSKNDFVQLKNDGR